MTTDGLCKAPWKGLEPLTYGLEGGNHVVLSVANKEVTSTPFPACTKSCTSKPENANGTPSNTNQHNNGEEGSQDDPLLKIAAALQAIPPDALAGLAKLIDAIAQQHEKPK